MELPKAINRKPFKLSKTNATLRRQTIHKHAWEVAKKLPIYGPPCSGILEKLIEIH